VRSHKPRKRRVLGLPIPHIRGLLSECDWWQPRLLQPEPVARTVSGNPLQTPETPLAILTSARRGAVDCGELCQAPRSIAKDLRRVPSYNVLAVVSCDGEHHDAATTTWNFCCRNDCYCGLRLHLHAETKKGPLNTARNGLGAWPRATRRGGSRPISPSCRSFCGHNRLPDVRRIACSEKRPCCGTQPRRLSRCESIFLATATT
jgi:hypothetical protein